MKQSEPMCTEQKTDPKHKDGEEEEEKQKKYQTKPSKTSRISSGCRDVWT